MFNRRIVAAFGVCAVAKAMAQLVVSGFGLVYHQPCGK